MTRRFLLMAVVVSGSLALPALCKQPDQAGAVPTEQTVALGKNAAVLYWKAWADSELYQREPGASAKINAVVNMVDNPADSGALPPDILLDLQDECGICRRVIDDVLEATKIPEADFCLDRTKGILTLLPHLGKIRISKKLLAADTYRCLQERKIDDAVERIVGLYRMGHHVTSDRFLISSLVSMSCYTLADHRTDSLISSGNLSASAKAALLVEARKAADPDSAGTRAALRSERGWYAVGGWFRTRYIGVGAGERLVREIFQECAQNMDTPVRQMDGQTLQTEFELMYRLYSDILSVWDLPDAVERLKGIDGLTCQGVYGSLAQLLGPALLKVKENENRFVDSHANLLIRLENAATVN